MWSVIPEPVNELTPVYIPERSLDLSVEPLRNTFMYGNSGFWRWSTVWYFLSPNPCCTGCIFFTAYLVQRILKSWGRIHSSLCVCHICVLLWREGSWRSSISASPHWLYCPFSQLHYHIVSSASCVLSPPLVVLWNLGNFLFTLSKFSQKCPRWPLTAALMWLLYTDLVGWQPVNHTGAPVIKVKKDFTLDYTELYTGSYDCNQTHCLRDIEVSSCCKCQCVSYLICRQLPFSLGGRGGGWVVLQVNKMPFGRKMLNIGFTHLSKIVLLWN